MIRELRPALIALLVFTLLTGFAYPLIVTGAAQLAFPEAAQGSLVRDAGGHVQGSALIGQGFTRPGYFWTRPSYAGDGWDASRSSGSNLGPLNPALHEAVAARIAALRAADPTNQAPVPIDLVTASGSGLDPHISPAAAEYQVARVARARGMPRTEVATLVTAYTRERLLGIFGEPVVDVLALNRALDAAEPAP